LTSGTPIKEESPAFITSEIWNILFSRIQSLSEDHRAEVRRTNISTLENIVMRHGLTFGPAVNNTIWSSLMKEVLVSMFNIAVDKY
jgi:PHP family Zn ribbon phosphoesterase